MTYGVKIAIYTAGILLICAILGLLSAKFLNKNKKVFSIICHFFCSSVLCVILLKIIPCLIYKTHALFISCGVILGVIITMILNDFIYKAGKNDSLFIILFSFSFADFILGMCFSKGYFSPFVFFIILIFEIVKFYICYLIFLFYSNNIFKSILSLAFFIISFSFGAFIATILTLKIKSLTILISLSIGSLIYCILAFLLFKSRKIYNGKLTAISMIMAMILIIIGCFWI